MYQHRGPHTGTGIGGTGGEISKIGVIVILKVATNILVILGGQFVRSFGIKSGSQRLSAKMVLFVDHNRNAFELIDMNRFVLFAVEKSRRDQVSFNQEATVEFIDIISFVIVTFGQQGRTRHG